MSKEELQKQIDFLIERNDEKQQKIDKAIKYIKKNIDNTGWLEIGSSNVKELLEILGDKQWKYILKRYLIILEINRKK